MIIDCEGCAARPTACGDCVVSVLLGANTAEGDGDGESFLPSGAPALSLDAPERRALDVLAEQGLVPHLRLVPTTAHRPGSNGHTGMEGRDVG